MGCGCNLIAADIDFSLGVYISVVGLGKQHRLPCTDDRLDAWPDRALQKGGRIMAGKVLVEVPNPLTEDTKAVVALLKCLGRPYSPLPDAVKLPNMVLVLSSKKDVFYTVTARDCSCPARTYHPGQACKHMKRFFTEAQIPKKTLLEEMVDQRYEMSFTPEDEPEAAEKPASAKVVEAKVKCEESRQEAHKYQTKMRLAGRTSKLSQTDPVDSIMPSMVGFRPILE